MKCSENRKELVSEIRSLAQSQGLNTVFTTFLEIAANSLAAQTDPENAEKREQRYQEMASTMTPELLSSYARMLALLFLTVREYRDDPCDILGGIYHELNLNNEWNGQYLTPDHICRFMAQITLPSEELSAEPTCGSGTMDFHGSVDITDPCYNRDVWCRMTDVKIRKGVYTCIAWHHKDKGTFDNGEPYCYDVIGIIGIYLDGVIPCQKDMKEIGSIGVDAGLAGFFHNKPDYTDGEWAAFCDRVRHGDVWLTKDGFYSSSGYGDGCYGVYAYKQGGEITAIEIRFL